ncbi:MAG: DUF4190 domain-containing protein [Pseudobutyrivibrio sp.]|nr:DUF4190 domain-containing protein [Pseudobutyrivibrio sp.]
MSESDVLYYKEIVETSGKSVTVEVENSSSTMDWKKSQKELKMEETRRKLSELKGFSGLAKASTIFGSIGILLGPAFSIPGLVLGLDFLKKQKEIGIEGDDSTLATAGCILSASALIVWIIGLGIVISTFSIDDFPAITAKEPETSETILISTDGYYYEDIDDLSSSDRLNRQRQDALDILEKQYKQDNHSNEFELDRNYLYCYDGTYNKHVSLSNHQNLDTGWIDLEIREYEDNESLMKTERRYLSEQHKYDLQSNEYYKSDNLRGYYDEELKYSIWTLYNYDDNSYEGSYDSYVYYTCADDNYFYEIEAKFDAGTDYDKSIDFISEYCEKENLPVPDFPEVPN